MRGAILLAFATLTGCTADPDSRPPSITLDTSSSCGGIADACINAGATTQVVAGVHVIHKPIKGDPVVAVRVLFDAGDRSGAELWSQDAALIMLNIGGPKEFAFSDWRAAKTAIGASVSASVGVDYAGLSAVVPVTYWNDLWSLLVRALQNPSNDDYLLDYLSGAIGHSYDTELDDRGSAASVTATTSLLAGTLGNRFRETRDELNRVTMSDVDEAWAGLLTKERLWVVVVGDVALSDLTDKVEHAFGGLPSHAATGFPAPPTPAAPPSVNQAAVLDYPDAPNWQVTGYFLGPAPTEPDYAALDVGMKLLDRRLFAEVRQARGLAYSVHASLDFSRQPVGVLDLATSAPSDALPVLRQVMSDLVETPVSSDELAAARALSSASLVMANRTPSAIAATLGAFQLTVGDRLGVESYLNALSGVTSEDARRALERYLRAVSLAAAGSGGQLDEASLLGILPGRARDGGTDSGVDAGPRGATDAGP